MAMQYEDDISWSKSKIIRVIKGVRNGLGGKKEGHFKIGGM